MIRPENLQLWKGSDNALKYTGAIQQTLFRGTELEVQVRLKNSESLRFLMSSSEWAQSQKKIGDMIELEVNPALTRLYNQDPR